MSSFETPDLRRQLLAGLTPQFLALLDAEERAVVEVSSGDMGNKPDAVKLGWLKMRTGDVWTKQRYTRTFKRAIDKLRDKVSAGDEGSGS